MCTNPVRVIFVIPLFRTAAVFNYLMVTARASVTVKVRVSKVLGLEYVNGSDWG